jgi:hypothetical protein
VSYLMVAALFVGCAKLATTTATTPAPTEEEPHQDAEPVGAT